MNAPFKPVPDASAVAELAWALPLTPLVARALARAGAGRAHLVGGILRDAALGEGDSADFDVALPRVPPGLSDALARELGGTAFLLDSETDAWRVALPGAATVDLVAYRAPSLEEDLAGRDFTVNALALDLLDPRAPLVDPLGGLADLGQRALRLCSPLSLSADPLRVLRAYRFLSSRDFSISPDLSAALGAHAPGLRETSVERVRDEFFRMLDGPRAEAALRRMAEDGVLASLFPFVEAWVGFDQGSYHSYDLLEHSLRAVAEVERLCADAPLAARFPWLAAHLGQRHEGFVTRRALLKAAAFFHDVAKPATATTQAGGRRRFIGHDLAGGRFLRDALTEWKVGNAASRAAESLVASHMRLFGLAHQAKPTRRSRLKFLRDLGDEAPEAVLLAWADEVATGPQAPARRSLESAGEELLDLFANPEVDAAPLLMGRDLISILGMEPGREIGKVLSAVAEAEGRGEVETREEALALAASLLAKGGHLPAGQKKRTV